jgi:curved DNA-binding protein CbpA
MKWLCVLVVLLYVVAQQISDPYRVLGVSKQASTGEIRRRFQTLAKQYHPDKNSDVNADAKFAEIRAAYDILMDPEQRMKLDNPRQYGFHRSSTSTQSFPTKAISLSQKTFQLLVQESALSGRFWVVQVFASHCHECILFSSAWESFVEQTKGAIRCGRVDRNKDRDLAYYLGIRGGLHRPAILFFQDGNLVDRISVAGNTDVDSLIDYSINFFFREIPQILKSVNQFEKWNKDNISRTRIVFLSKTRSRPHFIEYVLNKHFENQFKFAHVYVPIAETDLIDILLGKESDKVFPSVSVFRDHGIRPLVLFGEDVSANPEFMIHRFEKLKYSVLPELSPQNFLDLCGDSSGPLCVIAAAKDEETARLFMKPLINALDDLLSFQFGWFSVWRQKKFFQSINLNASAAHSLIIAINLAKQQVSEKQFLDSID